MLHHLTLADIFWDPTGLNIRGFLVVVAGLIVWMGSIYYILSTNQGVRMGFLLAFSAFMGWMVIMGSIWWIYGIGLKGDVATWKVLEVNYDRTETLATTEVQDLPNPDELPTAKEIFEKYPALVEELVKVEKTKFEDEEAMTRLKLNDIATLAPDLVEEVGNLNGWTLAPATNPNFGEAQSQATAELTSMGIITTEQPFVVEDTYFKGQPEDRSKLVCEPIELEFSDCASRFSKWVKASTDYPHEKWYAVVTFRQAETPEVPFGEAPPPTTARDDVTTTSVIMIRDWGTLRNNAALITIGSAALFGVTLLLFQSRERRYNDNRAQKAA